MIHFETHGIFLRLFGLRSSDLFVIRIHAHVFRKRSFFVCVCRQPFLPCPVIEKPAFKSMIVLLRRGRQRQAFVSRSFYAIDRLPVYIKCDRVFRSDRRFVFEVIRIHAHVFRKRSFFVCVCRQPFLPCPVIEKPAFKSMIVLLRRGRQRQAFVSRSFYAIDRLPVYIKCDRVFRSDRRFVFEVIRIDVDVLSIPVRQKYPLSIHPSIYPYPKTSP